MAIFHIDADAFFASVEQAFNPLLRDRPVVVGGSERQRGVVHTASYEARARGVTTGMPLVEAKRICPEAVFLKGNYQHYHAVSQSLKNIYLRYTPAVEFTSLDDAYLDMRGTERLYPAWPVLAETIQREVRDTLGIGVSIGVGSSKLIARIASDLRKPGGITCVEEGSERAFLHGLALEELPGVGRKTRERLNELGVTTVGELASLPRMVLNQLFGAAGATLWEFANAIDGRAVRRRVLPGQVSRSTTFEEDQTDPALIQATLQYLTERIAARLRHDGQRCRRVQVTVRYSDFSRRQGSTTLSRPADGTAELFAAVGTVMERLPERRLRVRHVGVTVSLIDWKEGELLFEELDRRAEELDAAVDDIRERFGFMSILPADALVLRGRYRMEKNGYVLHSPALTK